MPWEQCDKSDKLTREFWTDHIHMWHPAGHSVKLFHMMQTVQWTAICTAEPQCCSVQGDSNAITC